MLVPRAEIERLTESLERDFNLNLITYDEDAYQSLSFCLIDAVFSIQAKYEAVILVVKRYCDAYGLQRLRPSRKIIPPRQEQDSLQELLERIDVHGSDLFAAEVLQNRCRTSARSGILKAEAVRRFASILADFGINHLQDIPRAVSNTQLECALKAIPGHRKGIAFSYMLMEAGNDDLVKPDTMVLSYLGRTLNRSVRTDECQTLLAESSSLLAVRFPQVTPRSIDKLIWHHERVVRARSELIGDRRTQDKASATRIAEGARCQSFSRSDPS